MSSAFCYRGRKGEASEIEFIQRLVAENPQWSRRRLWAQLCAAWNWVQANGAPRDLVCRGLRLSLHRAGISAVSEGCEPGRPPVGAGGARWAAALPACGLWAGNVPRSGTIQRHLLSGGQLDLSGPDDRSGPPRSDPPAQPIFPATLYLLQRLRDQLYGQLFAESGRKVLAAAVRGLDDAQAVRGAGSQMQSSLQCPRRSSGSVQRTF